MNTEVKNALLYQIQKVQKTCERLYGIGVISPHIPGTNTIHLTPKLFLDLAKNNYEIKERPGNTHYPYKLEAEINGLELFTLLSETEKNLLVGKEA